MKPTFLHGLRLICFSMLACFHAHAGNTLLLDSYYPRVTLGLDADAPILFVRSPVVVQVGAWPEVLASAVVVPRHIHATNPSIYTRNGADCNLLSLTGVRVEAQQVAANHYRITLDGSRFSQLNSPEGWNLTLDQVLDAAEKAIRMTFPEQSEGQVNKLEFVRLPPK